MIELAQNRTFDLLAYGDPNVDHVFATRHVPVADEKVLGRNLGLFPGGTVANVACAASRMGARVAAYGRVGDDHGGRLLREANAAFNVASGFLVAAPYPTAAAMIIVDEAGEKALVYAPMPAAEVDAARLTAALVQSRILYAMPYDLEEFQQVSGLARLAGCRVAIDIEAAVAPDRDRLSALLACADIVFMNEGGYRATSPGPVTPEGVATLLDLGPSLVVTTLGAEGAIAVTRTERCSHPAFPARVVDATGAGDCFNGAFLAALLGEARLAKALRLACAAASISVSGTGARTALPSAEQVAELLSRDMPEDWRTLRLD